MAEINNVIAEASQDLQTIEDFVNLPAGSVVNPRLLPSVNVGTLAGTRDAIFKAGGLPAEPFETKAQMTSEGASLPDGQLSMVHNDTVNNGLYVKTAGAWVKSSFSLGAGLDNNPTISTVEVGEFIPESVSYLKTAGRGYGVTITEKGFLTSLAVGSLGGKTQITLKIFRLVTKEFELLHEVDLELPNSKSEVILKEPIYVNRGDVLILTYNSGSALKANTSATAINRNKGWFSSASNIEVGEKTSLILTAIEPDVTYKVTNTINRDITSQDSLSNILLEDNYNRETLVSGGILNSLLTTSPVNLIQAMLPNMSVSGKINIIKYTTNSNNKYISAILYIAEMSTDPLDYIIKKAIPVTGKSNEFGVVELTDGKNFDDLILAKGAVLAIAGLDEYSTVMTAESPSYLSLRVSSSSITHNARVPFVLSKGVALSLEVNLEVLKDKKNTGSSIFDESFLGSSLPLGWSEQGGWVVANQAESPLLGDWQTLLLSPSFSAMSNRRYTVDFEVADTSSVFGFCTTAIEANSGAAVAMVDGLQNKLILYKWDGASEGTPVVDVIIPPLVAGDKYSLHVEKDGWFTKLILVNNSTYSKTELEYKLIAEYVQFHGKAGVVFISGAISVTRFRFTPLRKRDVKVLVIGDSNAERAADIEPNTTWPFQIGNIIPKSEVVVSARSGEESVNLLKRVLYDISWWSPEYVIIAIGGNDGAASLWEQRIRDVVYLCKSIGSKVVIATVIPKSEEVSTRVLMNNEILNDALGGDFIVDFAESVSVGGARTIMKPEYDSGDGRHVNSLGQKAMLSRLVRDVPEIFNRSYL